MMSLRKVARSLITISADIIMFALGLVVLTFILSLRFIYDPIINILGRMRDKSDSVQFYTTKFGSFKAEVNKRICEERVIIDCDLLHDDYHFGDDQAAFVGRALVDNSTVKVLGIHSCSSLSTAGWSSLWACLKNNTSWIKRLNLYWNKFGDDELRVLGDAIASNTTLKALALRGCKGITAAGWMYFVPCLKEIKELDISANGIKDEELVAISSDLTKNKSLESIDLGDNYDISATGWGALEETICNKTSINETFLSNHTLKNVKYDHFLSRLNKGTYFLRRQLLSALKDNADKDPSQVARHKVIKYHKLALTQEFLEMEAGVIPHAIAWIVMDDHGHALLYELLTKAYRVFK